MIDLHTHTTASDGRRAPADLVRAAWLAGLRVLAVTDHDTTAGIAEARAHAGRFGLAFVAGIEITAVEGGRDIHVLGYLADEAQPAVQAFLARQRETRLERVRRIGERLAALGKPIELRALLHEASEEGKSVGRPAVAEALVAAGHVARVQEAFDLYLAEGQPACVPRGGPTVAEVVDMVHRAGGLVSLAHPAVTDADVRIPDWAAAGLDALEAYHSDHTPEDTARYLALAADLNLAVTGGSDYHGDTRAERSCLGYTTLPQQEFDRLVQGRGSGLLPLSNPYAVSRPGAEGTSRNS